MSVTCADETQSRPGPGPVGQEEKTKAQGGVHAPVLSHERSIFQGVKGQVVLLLSFQNKSFF